MIVTSSEVLGFLAATAPLNLVPGTGFVLLLRWTGHSGRIGGWKAATGGIVGLCAYLTLSVTGVSALLERSPGVLKGIQLAGALYLLTIGLRTLAVATVRSSLKDGQALSARLAGSPLLESMLSSLMNPKALLIYVAMAPTFLPARATAGDFLVLGAAHVLSVAVWMLFLVELIIRVGRRSRETGRSRVLSAVSGAALSAYGIIWIVR
ncbi:LysE family translocator [Kribbella sp. NPDC003505]|uniref:LysE family translocator n=1 Tax=Kribbella sp. NPDC003505 TaxID=3154448 RepID=UPI0033A0780A